MKILNKIGAYSLILIVIIFLVGCPRFAYVKIYNNTGIPIRVWNQHEEFLVQKNEIVRFKLSYEFHVITEEGTWIYSRSVPYNGEDGPFFDGTLTVQIEPDGKVYAIPVGIEPPIYKFSVQPVGFPLIPSPVY